MRWRARSGVVVACVDAHRGEVYAARYEGGSRVDRPSARAPGDLAADLPAGALLVGNGAARYREELGGFAVREALPDADDVVALALPRLEEGDADDARALEPLYVRRSDAEIKWDERGVRIERPMRVRYPGQER
jgi:tRNA threonylcarbamoyladenosine biosynthesis protein TsaB